MDTSLNSGLSHLKKDATDSEKPVKTVLRRTKGTPDTDTVGRNAKRYRHVKNCILKKRVAPSINAVRQVEYGDKRMGDTTAIKYLEAMVNEGILKKMGNRYELAA